MGFGELVVLVIVAIVVIGPKDLPKVLKKLGQWSGKLRRMAGDMRAQSGIDDVLREGDLGRDINEIRKLARGEIESVSRDMRIDAGAITTTGTTVSDTSYGGGRNGYSGGGGYTPDPYLSSRYVSEDREHPGVGPDGFDAMPDTSYVYGASFPRSALDRDPLYRTGAVDGVVPDDPPEPTDDENENEDEGPAEPAEDEASEGTASGPSPAAPADGDTPTVEAAPPKEADAASPSGAEKATP